MKILILYYEPIIRPMLRLLLEAEGYPFTDTSSASEAIQAIENSDDSYLLLTDNFHVNREALEALTTLHNRPELRRRLWIVGLTGSTSPEWVADGLIDEHLSMPFTSDQVYDIIQAHVGPPPN